MATKDDDDYLDMNDDLLDDDLLDADLDALDDDAYDDDDESWDDTANAEPAPKKKSSLVTILLVTTAIVVGGGIVLTQLGKSPTPNAPQQEVVLNQDMEQPVPTMSDDLASIQDAPPIQDAMPTPAPEQPQAGFMNNPAELEQSLNQNAAPLLNDDQSANALPVPQNLPSIDLIKKAPSIQAEELAPPAELPVAIAPTPEPTPAPVLEPTPTPAPVVTSTPTTDTALAAKLDQVMNRLDALEKKQAAPAASTATPDLARLSAALERLESKVDQLSSTKSTPRTSASSFSDDTPIKVNPSPRPKVVKKKVKEPAYKPPVQSDKWILRSARPGEAMVAKSGQADLKTIRVGDSIVGIGQIKSIAQVGGAWVVQGTSGRISQ